MNAETLLERLHAEGKPGDAERMAQYHKVPRRYLGVRVPVITRLAREYWQESGGVGLMACCRGLWQAEIPEEWGSHLQSGATGTAVGKARWKGSLAPVVCWEPAKE